MPNVTETPLSLELLRSIDLICDAFETSWQEGQRPRIEDHLTAAAEAVRPALLAELLRTELE